MLNYLINDYLKNLSAGSVTPLITDLMLFLYIMLVFSERKWNWVGIGWRLLEVLILWVIRIFLSSVIYAIPALFAFLSSYNTMYVVYPLLVVVYLIFFSKRKTIFKVLQGVTFYAFYILSFSLGYDIMEMLNGIFGLDFTYLMTLIQIGSMLFICYFLRKRNPDRFLYLSNSAVVLIVLIGIACFVLCFAGRLLVSDADANTNRFIVLFHFCFLFIEIGGYQLFYASTVEYNKRIYSETEKKMRQGEQAIIALSQASMEKLRKMRHDMKNQYAIMNELIQRKAYAELQAYFMEYAETIGSATNGYDSGNKILDCLINAESSKAADRCVVLDAKIKVSPKLSFGEIDLCTLLFNVIDNAIEGAAGFEEKEKRMVNLSVREKGDFLMIRCVNSVKEELLVQDSEKKYLTGKKEEGHGYGLKIIRDIVRRYDGEMNIAIADGCFVLDIMLQSIEEENKDE